MINEANMKDINSKVSIFFNGGGGFLKRILLSIFNRKMLDKFHKDTFFAEEYEQIIDKEKGRPKKKFVITDVASYSDWYKRAKQKQDQDFLKPVYEMKDYITNNFSDKELLGFYVHGSISTLDYAPYYSDFDTLFIIRSEVFKNKEWLMDLRRRIIASNTFLYLLDPLQHHGHFIISEYEMKNYKQSIFPLKLFEYATEFTDYNNDLNFYATEDSLGNNNHFAYQTGFLLNPEEFGYNNKSEYSLKTYVQFLLLLPAIFLQCKDRRYRYKRDTFVECKKIIPMEVYQIIDKASEVRTNCPFHTGYGYQLRKFIGIKMHPRCLHHLHAKHDKDNLRKMLMYLGDDYRKAVSRLVDVMEKILNDNK